jgi:manganese/zinc/iron transport system ATP- binding protein
VTITDAPSLLAAAPPAPAAAASPLLRIHELCVGYERQPILPPISAAIAPGQMWAVIGPNGAGKSTFVRTVLGLQPAVSGRIDRAPGLRMSYVPQHGALDTIFPISVLEFALMGRQGPRRIVGPPRRADLDAARAALAEVGAGDLVRRQIRDLSGGQRQRVLIARAIASRANLFVLDEPTAALDIVSERQVMELIAALRARGDAGVIMVTHLIEDGLERADRALLLDRDHHAAIAASAAELRADPAFQKIYGRALARAEAVPS